MAVKQLSDADPDGTTLGQSVTDLIGFHGAAPSQAMAVQTLATAATIATIRTALQTLLASLKTKGLMKTS